MSEVSKNISFEFLSDDPERSDSFSGKGHERSAYALSNAIVNFSDDDRSIGLEGVWGSGKTTVVAIAESHLAKKYPEKYAFYTYDLWANQNIDFRRAFLEDFLGWSKQFLNKKQDEELDKRVKGKTKTIETENQLEFSVLGYFIMSSLVLLPVLVLWLSPFSANLHKGNAAQNLVETSQSEIPWLFQILYAYGHWAAFAVICSVVLAFIIQTFYYSRKTKNFRKSLDMSFSLLTRKSEKDTITQTIRDGDPTKYEFYDIFTEILSLIQAKDRRIVLVFDNIDRLPESHIQEAWSNVRSIFSRDSRGKIHSNSFVTAVVPYDRTHVLSALDESRNDSSHQNGNDSHFINGQNQSPPYILEDIFRKTFSAIITVATPVTSDIEIFFERCIESALPSVLDTGQKYRLFQIFDVFLNELSMNPTPRQVKAFINDVGMLVQQWKTTISIEAIAIFVLHRSHLESNPKSLQKPDTINRRYLHYIVAGSIYKELAALAYNVEPDIALEILLERDISAALLNNSSERLKELSNSPVFRLQLNNILEQNCSSWASSSLKDFQTALVNYSQLNLDESVKELCDKRFTQVISDFKKISLEDWESYNQLFCIVECIPKEYLSVNVQSIANWIERSLPEELTSESGRIWIKFIGGFIERIKDIYGEKVAKDACKSISIQFNTDFYLGIATDCDEVNLHFSDFTNFAKDKSNELSIALAKYGELNSEFFEYAWDELEFALSNEEKSSIFNKLLSDMANDTLEVEGERENYFENLVLISSSVENKGNVKTSLTQAITDGYLQWHAQKFEEFKDLHNIGNAIWLVEICTGPNKIPDLSITDNDELGDLTEPDMWFSEYYESELEKETIETLADLVISNNMVDRWVTNFSQMPNRLMYQTVLEKVFNSDDYPALSMDTFIKHYECLMRQFDNRLISEIINRTGAASVDENSVQLEISNISPVLVNDLASRKDSNWNFLINKVDLYLKSISSEDWKAALTSDNHNRQLLITRAHDLVHQIPPNNLRTPLADYLAEIMTSSEPQPDSLHDHEAFWLVLPSGSQKGLASDLLERVANKPVTSIGLETVLNTFPKIFSEMPLDNQQDVVISKILIPLINGKPSLALDIVKERPSEWQSCVSEASPEIRVQLNEYIEGHEGNEIIQTQLDDLRKLIKLRRRRKVKQVDQQNTEADNPDSTD